MYFHRFVVGPFEENDYSKPLLSHQSPQLNTVPNQHNTIRQVITDIHQAYCSIDDSLKQIWISDVCPHTNGCLHYIISVSNKLFEKKNYFNMYNKFNILHFDCIVWNKIIFSWLLFTIMFEVFVTSQSNFT